MPRRKISSSDDGSERGRNSSRSSSQLHPEAQKAILIILLFAAGVVSVLSLIDMAGKAGHGIAYTIELFFGWGSFLFPLVLMGLGYVYIFPNRYQISTLHYAGLILFLLSLLGIFHLFIPVNDMLRAIPKGTGGGYFGLILAYPGQKFLGFWASFVVLLAAFFIALFLVFNLAIMRFFSGLGGIGAALERVRDRIALWRAASNEDDEEVTYENENAQESAQKKADTPAVATEVIPSDVEPSDMVRADSGRVQTEMPLPPRRFRRKIDIPVRLLSDASEKPTSGDIQYNKERIQKTLENFGIDVSMHDVNVGPTVTQYTLKPADGVKLSQIVALQKDLALALAAHPIRIEAPIPGKALVGIEVPNKSAAIVRMRELLKSVQFKKRNSNLSIALGKDVTGESYFADLDRMPHLLIAGATGSGKSVAINSIITSLLFQNSPSDLKLILVDPKRVELSIYNDIPYLLTPVITDSAKTINALKWAVSEMDRRYELLSQTHKRNIASYNAASEDPLPYIVIIVDELADLMAVAAQEIEGIIIRLAQMARAVGIHLVLATQRPSVDVLTGLIKANITARMAFSVASVIDSRTILDFQGAEKLLGKGDMLYICAELSKPVRIQGVFIDEVEIGNVVSYLKQQGEAEYNEDIVTKQHRVVVPGMYQDDENDDELLGEAKQVLVRAGKASASLLQRRLRVGYARAARILDILEDQGIIGPADGAKPREVLVTQSDLENATDSGNRNEQDVGSINEENIEDDSEFQKRNF